MQMQGDELRAIREVAGMTQDEFAAELGMSRKAINEMEAGKAQIAHRTALAASVLAPLVPAFVIGGKADGQLVLVPDGLSKIRVSLPKWMPPFVGPGGAGSAAPTLTYKLFDAGDDIPERVFVPADEEPDRDAVRVRINELRAAGTISTSKLG